MWTICGPYAGAVQAVCGVFGDLLLGKMWTLCGPLADSMSGICGPNAGPYVECMWERMRIMCGPDAGPYEDGGSMWTLRGPYVVRMRGSMWDFVWDRTWAVGGPYVGRIWGL